MPPNVRDAVARRDDKKPDVLAGIKADVRKSREWFDSVAPKHVDADQFVSLCLGAIRKGDRLLQQACLDAPWTFMQAASECAQHGLVPGETYHFVAFKNNREQRYEIVGIVDYKGEIDQIYRAGGVRAVHCHVVRARDTFVWRPGSMERPHHIIHAPEPDEALAEKYPAEIVAAMKAQEGLAGDEERGPLTGVYAYAEMADGGYSQPIVMSASTVKKHRDAAKTEKFWGPKWPEEGPWTPDMWRKTAIHKLFDMVPHSAEYLAERLRVAATVERIPEAVPGLVQRPAIAQAPPPAVAGEAVPPAGAPPADQGEPAGDDSGTAPPGDDEDARARQVSETRISAIFRECKLGGKDMASARRTIITGLIAGDNPADYVDPDKLTTPALVAAADALEKYVGKIESGGADVKDSLLAYAVAIEDKIMGAQQ